MRNHALREYNERVLIRSLDARYKQSVSRMEARVQALEAAGDTENYQIAVHDLQQKQIAYEASRAELQGLKER